MNSRKIIADINQMTSAITNAETTANPSATLTLQEARRYLILASMAVQRAKAKQEMEDLPAIKASAAVTMEAGQEMDKYVVIG